jgi:hypothetical protein
VPVYSSLSDAEIERVGTLVRREVEKLTQPHRAPASVASEGRR